MSVAPGKRQSVIAPGRRGEWGRSEALRATWRLPSCLRCFSVGVTASSWTATPLLRCLLKDSGTIDSYRLGIIEVLWLHVFWSWIVTCLSLGRLHQFPSLCTRGTNTKHPLYSHPLPQQCFYHSSVYSWWSALHLELPFIWKKFYYVVKSYLNLFLCQL